MREYGGGMGAGTAYLIRVVKDGLIDKVRFGQSPKLDKRANHRQTGNNNVLSKEGCNIKVLKSQPG